MWFSMRVRMQPRTEINCYHEKGLRRRILGWTCWVRISAVISWGDYGTTSEDDEAFYFIQETIVRSKPIFLGHKIKDYYNFNISEIDPKLLVSLKKPVLKHSSKYDSIESYSEPTNEKFWKVVDVLKRET